MQASGQIYQKYSPTQNYASKSPTFELLDPVSAEKETIHSGHFMVSHFEAEEQDEEEGMTIAVTDTNENKLTKFVDRGITQPTKNQQLASSSKLKVSIETNLTKLFQCMTLAYRQKLTSPKWNRFKGVRLRWKDKIRLNNVIWRCWHMQFIKKQNAVVVQFASPLDVDTHNKPEAIVLEGKYWKRRLAAVTAEYKKWRVFHRNRIIDWANKENAELLYEMDVMDWQPNSNDSGNMLADEDYMEFMSDTLFSTIAANQPYAFPDSREIARAGLADFIQPSLGPLQPNLEDFMDTLQPLQDLFSSKLPSVPEEPQEFYKPLAITSGSYSSLNDVVSQSSNISANQITYNLPTKNYCSPSTAQVLTNDLSDSSLNTNYSKASSHIDNFMSNMTNLGYIESQSDPVPLSSQTATATSIASLLSASQPSLTDQLDEALLKQQIMQDIVKTSDALIQNAESQQSNHIDQILPPSNIQQQSLIIQQQEEEKQLVSKLQQQQLKNKVLAERLKTQKKMNQQQHVQQIQQQQQIQQSQNIDMTYSNRYQVYPNDPYLQFLQVKQESIEHNDDKLTQQQTQRSYYRMSSPSNTRVSRGKNVLAQSSMSTPDLQSLVSGTSGNSSFKIPSVPSVAGGSMESDKTHGRWSFDGSLGNLASMGNANVSLGHQSTVKTMGDVGNVQSKPQIKYQARRTLSSGSTRPQRVRSSSVGPKQTPPPLRSSASDPALLSNTNSVLLAQLLTNNSHMYNLNNNLVTQVIRNKQTYNIASSLAPTPATNLISASTSTKPSAAPIQKPIKNQRASFQTQQKLTTNLNISADSNASPSLSPLSPTSQDDPLGSPSSIATSPRGGGESYREKGRVGHIHAEQKRRYNIKNGFDMLHTLIPQLNQNPNAKSSKAAMLQKGAEYIKHLRFERNQIKDEIDSLSQQIECLNVSISNCQSLLPATGAPVSRQRAGKMREMYEDYVRRRTEENWKFWIFSVLFEPLLTSFNNSVATTSYDDLYRSTLLWVEQHCSLVDLRPTASNSLRALSTQTEILTNPERLPEEAKRAARGEKTGKHGDHGRGKSSEASTSHGLQ